MKDTIKKKDRKISEDQLSRKEWLVKAGKYTIFTSASMMMILLPSKEAAAQSAPPDDGTGFNQ